MLVLLTFKFEIRNNKLDQLQGMPAKMAANGMSAKMVPIRSHTLKLI